jgi:hypothetical protein
MNLLLIAEGFEQIQIQATESRIRWLKEQILYRL